MVFKETILLTWEAILFRKEGRKEGEEREERERKERKGAEEGEGERKERKGNKRKGKGREREREGGRRRGKETKRKKNLKQWVFTWNREQADSGLRRPISFLIFVI